MWENSGSLLDSENETFTLLNNTATSDGYGGFIRTWTDGPTFTGTLKDDQGTTARIGTVQTGKTFGALFVAKSVQLNHLDVFRRESTGRIYRVSDPNANATPKVADLDLTRYPVEQWDIPE